MPGHLRHPVLLQDPVDATDVPPTDRAPHVGDAPHPPGEAAPSTHPDDDDNVYLIGKGTRYDLVQVDTCAIGASRILIEADDEAHNTAAQSTAGPPDPARPRPGGEGRSSSGALHLHHLGAARPHDTCPAVRQPTTNKSEQPFACPARARLRRDGPRPPLPVAARRSVGTSPRSPIATGKPGLTRAAPGASSSLTDCSRTHWERRPAGHVGKHD